MLPSSQAVARQSILVGKRALSRTFTSRLSTTPLTAPEGIVAHSLQRLRSKGLLRESAFVRGQWVETSKTFAVNDPGTGKPLARVPDFTAEEAESAIAGAHDAFSSWSTTPAAFRQVRLRQWYELIRQHEQDLAEILALENGKPLSEALGEVRYGATFIEWFSAEAVRSYGDIVRGPSKDNQYLVQKRPVGVCGILTPWNFPNAMITRKAGAALAAGCTVVVKPASETPLSALALAKLAKEAGIPDGVLNIITTSHENTAAIGKRFCSHPTLSKISFTGSTRVGKLMMEQSSSSLKRLSLELGGNAPLIVFKDADIDVAINGTMAAKFRNAGQACVSANRFYVHKDLLHEYVQKLGKRMDELSLGHSLAKGSSVGPLIHPQAVKKVSALVEDAIEHGATLARGGGHDDRFHDPTILIGAGKEARIHKEEIFGPVVHIIPFTNEDQVVAEANASDVGLASFFFTKDLARAWRVADALHVGMVGVNTGVVSTAVAPFGGVKGSGYGREGSKYGLDEYQEKKFVHMVTG
ncbi:aldehyde dehydrogenase domain-containing protein [Piptocephalis cylindrospora]|uniref:succinate-semialdehyde dehydrogenase [NAD(P)(+)] n=1 Tax=Piptocephalis cylindrospora TaxID=1907219 RepID=A0A4P9Y6F4_9FUNG|nr:aldehyde dehydrogenase domain-containing protein [Piptocephalis cylindrospora]|eukprot:RKP14666.1 aldehyde dehydrogenase domain-containing protein [Piptocephalis cylindrospora]